MKSAATAPWPRSLRFLISASGKVFSRPTKMPTRFMDLCYPPIGQIDRIRDGDPYFHPSRLFEPSYLSPGVVVKLIRQRCSAAGHYRQRASIPASGLAYVTIPTNPGELN